MNSKKHSASQRPECFFANMALKSVKVTGEFLF
jgi:hypothetical protein